jgi:hypothetical protein
MPLDRISSATPYAALALVQAATANAPKPATLAAEAFTGIVKTAVGGVMPEAAAALPAALQSREDRLGQGFDARA